MVHSYLQKLRGKHGSTTLTAASLANHLQSLNVAAFPLSTNKDHIKSNGRTNSDERSKHALGPGKAACHSDGQSTQKQGP
jgi:hypothetical protein